MSNKFQLPSNPDDLRRIRNAILEASAQKQMIADRNESIKDIRNDIKEQFDMPPKLFNQLVATHFKQSYKDVTTEHSQFELVYENVLGNGGPVADDEDDGE